jgi:putative membrane protein
MANERTFLAWLRTSIAVMAFGFVVERFSFFIRELSSITGTQNPSQPSHGYAAIIGIVLVTLGTLMGALGFVRYRRTRRQITENYYKPSIWLDFLFTAFVLVIGVLLIAYLAYNLITVNG